MISLFLFRTACEATCEAIREWQRKRNIATACNPRDDGFPNCGPPSSYCLSSVPWILVIQNSEWLRHVSKCKTWIRDSHRTILFVLPYPVVLRWGTARPVCPVRPYAIKILITLSNTALQDRTGRSAEFTRSLFCIRFVVKYYRNMRPSLPFKQVRFYSFLQANTFAHHSLTFVHKKPVYWRKY